LLPNLIANYKVMLYTGNVDLNCNILGVNNYLSVMEWAGYLHYYNTASKKWKVDGNLAGYAKNYGNFTTVVVRDSGHEVPFFQPANALAMINNFLFDVPF
jgi:carboxypeptidase C (cathepsin A)